MIRSSFAAPAILPAVFLWFFLGPSTAIGASSADELFRVVDEVREKAERAEAPLLAPGSYQDGVRLIERARRDAGEGRPVNAAQLDESRRLFQSALEHTRIAAVTFEKVLESREAARALEPWKYAASHWQTAERQFDEAARRVEKGDLQSGSDMAATAVERYAEAGRQALRNHYLAEARAALLAADQAGAKRHAPATREAAAQRLAEADAALLAGGASPETAAAIEAAHREAEHAARIAGTAQRVGRQGFRVEDLILEFEDVTVRLADAAGVPGGTIAGDPVAADRLVAEVAAVRMRADEAERELRERDRQLAGLEEELRELDDRLGGTTAERDRLMMTVAAQQRAREQLATLEALFTPAEGRVVREGDSIVLRLTGMDFRSGSAKLPPGSDPLLRKAEQAIALFPRASVRIEGHTDSSGSDAANRRLSEERARAVETRLRELLQLPAGRLQVEGHGAGRPVAGNDSATGRAQNRRIDIVIVGAAATP